jgi:transposase
LLSSQPNAVSLETPGIILTTHLCLTTLDLPATASGPTSHTRSARTGTGNSTMSQEHGREACCQKNASTRWNIDFFAIEREINGLTRQERVAVRSERSRPLIAELEVWLREQRGKLSSKSDTAKAINYSLRRWPMLTRFLDDGRLCISNNAGERTLRCVTVGRHNWTFAGSDEGGRRAAAMYTLIETAKLNDIDPQAWLADVLARLPDHPAKRISEFLPWNCRPPTRASCLTAHRVRRARGLHRRRTIHMNSYVTHSPIAPQGCVCRSKLRSR